MVRARSEYDQIIIESGILIRRTRSWRCREEVHVIVDHPLPHPEFSRPLDLSDLPAEGLSQALRSTPEECQALCRRFNLEGLRVLVADIRIAHVRDAEGDPAFRLEALICAEITQVCVVTLKPFHIKIEEAFTILFQFSAGREKELQEDDFGDDTTELLETTEIDAGELIAQHLALALDPHPRAPSAEWQGPADGSGAADMALITDGPFAKLGQLKHKM